MLNEIAVCASEAAFNTSPAFEDLQVLDQIKNKS